MTKDEQKKYWQTLCTLSGDINKINDERNTLLDNITYPSSLFRFRSVNENTLQALQDNQVYFSSAEFYDDPFDTYLRVDSESIKNDLERLQHENILDNVIPLLRNSFPKISVDKDKIKNIKFDYDSLQPQIMQLRNLFQKNLYSICFCEEVSNEVLWLKYAENHRGFVLEYTIDDSTLERLWRSRFNANILPIYYSDEKYDAYRYAIYTLTLYLVKDCPAIYNTILSKYHMEWECTKISTIKKSCHQFDKEWRIVPTYFPNQHQRESIDWKPKSVTIGLRTPEYKKRLIISSAKVAGVTEFYEMYIDNNDNFKRRAITINEINQ